MAVILSVLLNLTLYIKSKKEGGENKKKERELIPQSKEPQLQDARRDYAVATSGEEEEEEAMSS
jgi:hypothetical protein